VETRRHTLLNPLRQPRNRVLRGCEDCFLKDVIEIGEPSSMMLENSDRSAGVNVDQNSVLFDIWLLSMVVPHDHPCAGL
jgi:hypothetical protein